ncbi:MAG: hypothetical protein R2865_15700 [Deinococcales bacterium]
MTHMVDKVFLLQLATSNPVGIETHIFLKEVEVIKVGLRTKALGVEAVFNAKNSFVVVDKRAQFDALVILMAPFIEGFQSKQGLGATT